MEIKLQISLWLDGFWKTSEKSNDVPVFIPLLKGDRKNTEM